MMANHKKPPLLGIPASVKITDLAKRHGFQPKPESERHAAQAAFRAGQAKLSQTQESLDVPSPNSHSNLQYNTEVDDAWAELPVTAINFYEHNPRKANNEAYAELKESIRVNGILQPLTVTKRPDSTHYILFAGGNTRLAAIRELWEETGDEKFRTTRVICKTWRGESAVLLAHMAENTQRNDMTFWDRANGTLVIKRQMETESGSDKPLSYKEFETKLRSFGIQTDARAISVYRFAVERVPDIGPWLSHVSIRAIQPRLNLLLKLANHHDLEENAFYSQIVSPVARATAQEIMGGESFQYESFLAEVERAQCALLALSSNDLRRMLTALERFPNITVEDLRKLCRPATPPPAPAQPTELAPASTPLQARPAEPVAVPRPVVTPAATPEGRTASDAQASDRATSSQNVAPLLVTAQPGSQSALSTPSPEMAMAGSTQLMELVHLIVVEAGLGSCFVAAPAMPLGYLMGFPKDGPLDLKDQAQSRQAAWWVLAMASGQFDPETCRRGLEESSVWRGLILEDGDDEQTLGGLELEIQHNIGGQGEFLPIPWLMNAGNPIAGACLSLLALIREVRP